MIWKLQYIMKNSRFSIRLTASLLTLALAAVGVAQDAKPAEDKNAQMMAAMAELAKPNENHKVLEENAGTWNYKVKFWISPAAPPMEATGVSVVKSVMDGRFITSQNTGKMSMPGPDGKLMDSIYEGMGTEGYDNTKKKYVGSWIDNQGTGIMTMEGTYDPATKTLTYEGEEQAAPGVKFKMRQTIKTVDKDHRLIEFFQINGGKEVKLVEMTYARANSQ